MRRRRYIAVAGTALLSGCGSLGASSNQPTTETSDPDTPTQTAEPSPTPEPTPSVPTHDVGESFTVVGDADSDVTPAYTVTDVRTTDSIERDLGKSEAEGEFVVVAISISNQLNGSITVSSSQFHLKDGQGQSFEVDEDAIAGLSNPIAYETVDANDNLSGNIIFDVPADQDERYLEVAPVGLFSGAEAHRVVLSS